MLDLGKTNLTKTDQESVEMCKTKLNTKKIDKGHDVTHAL